MAWNRRRGSGLGGCGASRARAPLWGRTTRRGSETLKCDLEVRVRPRVAEADVLAWHSPLVASVSADEATEMSHGGESGRAMI